ncbi:MAG: carboxypeptidase regulatory-like domain-containing protein [Actinomycetota bacterium]
MSRPVRSPAYFVFSVMGMFVPLGLLAGASLRASEAQEESVLPGAPPLVVASSAIAPAAVKPALKLQVLRAGEAPYAWAIPGVIARSFVTNTPNTLEVTALAGLTARPELAEQIRWEVIPPAGFQLPSNADLQGPKLVLQLSRPNGNPNGMGEPLSLTVRARVVVDGRTEVRMATLTQDLRDRLRQEYVDLERAYVPSRDDLLDEQQFKLAYGKKYPGVAFASLNWSRLPGKEERYPVILAQEELVRTIEQTQALYGRPLVVSSGFRNPVRQVEVHGSVAESHHQYGRAVDLYVAPDSAAPKTGRDYASEGDWLRLAVATMRGGGGWVEPMTACHVNTNGCHVHVDVREQGVRTEVVQVNGKITDAAGLPVPDATVRLAGMPAKTNHWGLFSIKHVLTPKDYELTVEAPGRGVRTQRLAVGGALTTLAMRLPSDPNPALVARVDDTRYGPGGKVSVRISVRNAGPSSALGLRLAAAPIDLPSRGGRVSPAHLPLVRSGQETAVEVQLSADDPASAEDGGAMPVLLSASYRTDRGVARAQSLRLSVPMSERSTTAEASAIPLPRASRQKAGAGTPPEVGAAGGGLALGAAAAAAAGMARRKAKASSQPASDEPIEDLSSVLPGK